MDRTTMIDRLCQLEWQMFSQVRNNGGPASCQQDEGFFKKMRACQFKAWSDDMLARYRDDLAAAAACGRNLPMEKYAWMMESTHPDEFAAISDSLPPLSQEQRDCIAAIVATMLDWEAAVDRAYPHMRAGGRPLRKQQDTPWATSFETYLEGELKSYSLPTLRSYLAHVQELQRNGGNMALEVAEHTARAYGFASLAAMEEHQAARKKS